jgi:hypothetical protein
MLYIFWPIQTTNPHSQIKSATDFTTTLNAIKDVTSFKHIFREEVTVRLGSRV